MTADRRWFHCTTHTYGAWLYGVPRGFRTRHHREHVEGDYKNPPPAGKHQLQLDRSKRLMTQPPVVLPRELRPVVGGAMVDRLGQCGAQVLALSCSGQHVHLLAKMPGGEVPRQWVGRAKMHTTFVLRGHGWVGELWAVRSKVIPVRDRRHQLNVFHYILDHAAEGAWVWDFRHHSQSEHPESPGPAGPGL
jgi:hypothetical protein